MRAKRKKKTGGSRLSVVGMSGRGQPTPDAIPARAIGSDGRQSLKLRSMLLPMKSSTAASIASHANSSMFSSTGYSPAQDIG